MKRNALWGGKVTVNEIRIKTTPKNRVLRVDVRMGLKWVTVINSGYTVPDILDQGITANAVKCRARMQGGKK